MQATHIEVKLANSAAEVYGLFDGQILKVIKETPAFFFAATPDGTELKVSKKTKRCWYWSPLKISPVFNI